MQLFVAFAVGLVFGLGLILSGMTDPAKVLGFLDLGGRWDPSLLFVMGGAIAVAAIGFAFARKRGRALLGGPMRLPAAGAIDRRLVLGSAAFGIGWGLAGFCPGPAIAALASGSPEPLVFVAAMVAGMALFELFESMRGRAQKAA